MKIIILILIIISTYNMAQTNYNDINNEIANGNFTLASQLIDNVISSSELNFEELYNLNFTKEKLERIKKDFRKTKQDILSYVKTYIPEVDEKMLLHWEKDGSLEYKIIDGEKFYFNRSHTNLFLINKEAKRRKTLITKTKKDNLDLLLEKIVPQIFNEIKSNNSNFGNGNKFKLKYSLTVKENVVPNGEIIRCWLPFPREGNERQKLIEFNSNDDYIVADNDVLQRTIYFEKAAQKDKPTEFSYELFITTRPFYANIIPDSIKPYNEETDDYIRFTSERPPHIIFTDKIKNLSKKIIGDEKNPYLISKKIFTWINNNIPWAGAREYSTIDNISDYCLSRMHGDCGIKTILFMTLARYNGIPTKWQSGWMLHPGEINLHDWCEVYFEGYGWVPVDQSFGLVDSDNEEMKYFYLGGIDQYRFIVNDDYSTSLYPLKIFPRSETVDFQRGEVEWRGGNLYFDVWDYNMEIEYIK